MENAFVYINNTSMKGRVSYTLFNTIGVMNGSCKNYKNWIDSEFEEPADPQTFFNMGKCQGIMETTGKIMLTLCKERKRNVNIHKQLSANLEGIRTISLVKEYLAKASNISNLQRYNAQELLSIILSKRWPCN